MKKCIYKDIIGIYVKYIFKIGKVPPHSVNIIERCWEKGTNRWIIRKIDGLDKRIYIDRQIIGQTDKHEDRQTDR